MVKHAEIVLHSKWSNFRSRDHRFPSPKKCRKCSLSLFSYAIWIFLFQS